MIWNGKWKERELPFECSCNSSGSRFGMLWVCLLYSLRQSKEVPAEVQLASDPL